jgi:signal transduction histidine kinase
VLDLSQIESGNAEWHSSELDMREVVDDSVAAVSQMFRENGVELEVRMPQKLPSIVADRDRLMQVMLNLLSNAAKFCRRPGGRVSIALSRQDGFLRVDVTDNGSGISESDQEVIFEKFRQVGDTLTNRPQGTGLGLPICRQIINHFGGRLWVQSRPGAGATFSFTLPLDPAPAQSLAA